MKNDHYNYQQSLEKLTDEQLVETFNRLVGLQGWGNARAAYGSALRKEFMKRDFDSTLIIGSDTFSFAKKVILQNKRLVFM
jgi:hypothetical protein